MRAHAQNETAPAPVLVRLCQQTLERHYKQGEV